MLKIDLLPPSARKISLSPVEQFHRTPLMWIVVAGMIGFALSLLLPIGLRHRQLQRLNATIQALEPRKLEVDQIQRFLQQLRAQETAFQGLRKGRGLWAKRLNVLSDVTPEGVWFTELTLDPVKGLVIQGSAIGQGSEMDSVDRLVQDLKRDHDFASAVKEIQIESIKRVPERDIEIVQFTLACTLLEAPTL